MLELIFLFFVSAYFVQMFILITGLNKSFPRINKEELPLVSVIVAARNEEKNILACMQSLDKLIYPEGKLEVIIADDQSTDATGKIIADCIKDKKRFKTFEVKDSGGSLRGKPNAIAQAVKIASGEIILTTDADCIVNPLWAETIASYYTKETGMVCGFTGIQADNNFSGMQAVDLVYLLSVAGGTINHNYPVSCIGNNMSYRKKAYEEAGGYEKIPFSVTEDFKLLNAVCDLKKYKIIMPLQPDALIATTPCKDIKDLFRQKQRWAAGGMEVPLRAYPLLAVSFFTNLFSLLTPFFFASGFFPLLIFKVAADYFFIYPVHQRLGIKKNLKYFLTFELYYLIYVVILPFILLLNRKVIWKEREY